MAEIVSNHALIRYFQRVVGLENLVTDRPSASFARINAAGYDVAATREMLSVFVRDAAAAGAQQIRHDDITFKIAEGVLVTVYVGKHFRLTRSNKRSGQRIAYREARAQRGQRQHDSHRWREDRP